MPWVLLVFNSTLIRHSFLHLSSHNQELGQFPFASSWTIKLWNLIFPSSFYFRLYNSKGDRINIWIPPYRYRPYSTSKHHLGWRLWSRCFIIQSDPIYLKELLKGFFSWCSPNFFQSALQGINKSFSLSVKLRMKRGGSDVIDLVWFAELSRCKLASIVRNYDVYYTKLCEQLMKKFYGDFCYWVFTSM